MENLIEKAIENNVDAETLKSLIEFIQAEKERKIDAKKAFNKDVRKALEVIQPVIADCKTSDGIQYASYSSIKDTVDAALKGQPISYHVETLVSELGEQSQMIEVNLVIVDDNGYSEKWNSIQIPVELKEGESSVEAIERTSLSARKTAIINGFNLSISNDNQVNQENINGQIQQDDSFPMENGDTEIVFPEMSSMTQMVHEQSRAECEENIKVLAKQLGIQYEDAFRRLCVDAKIDNFNNRANWSDETWKKLNKTALHFMNTSVA